MFLKNKNKNSHRQLMSKLSSFVFVYNIVLETLFDVKLMYIYSNIEQSQNK